MAQMRLDKFLGEMGAGSRSQIKEMARKGRILVNGQVEKKSDRKVEPERDEICVDGQIVQYTAFEYWMLNKPQGVVSATEDNRYPTVVSLIKSAKRNDLFPVGRLDVDTEGLLLLTNDGELAHRLLSPKNHVDKVYYAKIQGQLPDDAQKRVEEGLVLEDGTRTLPAKLEIVTTDCPDVCLDACPEICSEIRLTIQEGKFHQVKRMMEVLGCRVVYLKRLSMGSLLLDEMLKPGEYRELTEKERESLSLLK